MNNTNSKDIGISNSYSNGGSDIAIDKNGDLGEKECNTSTKLPNFIYFEIQRSQLEGADTN